MTRTNWYRLSRTDDPPSYWDRCRCDDACRCDELREASKEAAADLRLLGRELDTDCEVGR